MFYVKICIYDDFRYKLYNNNFEFLHITKNIFFIIKFFEFLSLIMARVLKICLDFIKVFFFNL